MPGVPRPGRRHWPRRRLGDDDDSGEFYKPGSFSYRGQNEDTAELMRRIGPTVVGPDDSVNEESLDDLERLFLS